MIKMTKAKKVLSLLLCFVLIAAIVLFNGCNGNTNPETETPETTQASSPTAIGEGETTFTFTVTDLEGNETTFKIHTDKKLVGEALIEENLIQGESGAYGLYVKTVNGITLDYDKDGAYWAFYVDGEYASTGVDLTEIDANATYSFKAEKA